MDNGEIKLKPCPCGAAAEIARTRHKLSPRYWGRCTKERCDKQPECFEVFSEAQAADDWNDSINCEREAESAVSVDIRDDELMSCPFCGGKPKIQNNGDHEIVMCLNGSCYVQPSIRDRKTKAAREIWNTRVIDQ